MVLKLGAGQQHDSEDREGSLLLSPFDFDETFDAWLPGLEIAYDLSDKTRIGARGSPGFNPGGFTAGGNFATGLFTDEYDEETVWTYQMFLRTEIIDGRLQLGGNIFFFRLQWVSEVHHCQV